MTKWRTQTGRYTFKFGGSFFPVCLPTTRRIREPRTGRVGESQERLQRSEREWDEVIQVVIESLPERVQPLAESRSAAGGRVPRAAKEGASYAASTKERAQHHQSAQRYCLRRRTPCHATARELGSTTAV
ncbi:UNVERIFIED_CONTAM: hypothetical protein FKN15_031132 [Acipenser sinensis]